MEYLQLKQKLFGGNITRTKQGKGSFNPNCHINQLAVPVNEQTRVLRQLMYVDGKKTVKNILNLIDEKALAFWFFDDGNVDSNGRLTSSSIYTNGFDQSDVQLLVDYINNKWNLNTKLEYSRREYKNEDRLYPIIKINAEDTRKIVKIVAPYAPSCLEYKVTLEDIKTPPNERSWWFNKESKQVSNLVSEQEIQTGQWTRGKIEPNGFIEKFDYNQIKSFDYSAAYVSSVETLRNQNLGALYDIEVEDNHNFFSNGTLVHNCRLVRASGMKVWLIPWFELTHHGFFPYTGSLPAMAAAGLTATVDASKIKKKS